MNIYARTKTLFQYSLISAIRDMTFLKQCDIRPSTRDKRVIEVLVIIFRNFTMQNTVAKWTLRILTIQNITDIFFCIVTFMDSAQILLNLTL